MCAIMLLLIFLKDKESAVMFIRNKKHNETILAGVFVVPLFFGGIESQSVSAQSFDAVEPNITENELQNLLFSSGFLRVLGYGILAIVVVASVVVYLQCFILL